VHRGPARRRWAIVATAAAAMSLTSALPTGASTSTPRSAPVVKSFTSSNSNLANNGGTVKLTAKVAHAATCRFAVTHPLDWPGLWIRSCRTGVATLTFKIPVNKTYNIIKWVFELQASANHLAAIKTVTVTQNTNAALVTTFTATPSKVPASGGTVRLTADAVRASTCRFSSLPAGWSGLPKTVACATGSGSTTITFDKNPYPISNTYYFLASASGVAGGGVSKEISVTQAAGP